MPRNSPNDPGTTHASIFIALRTADAARREFSWERFGRLYTPYIRGYASLLGARGDTLDEIVQRVLVGFFSVSPTFVYRPETHGGFRAYLAYAVRSATYRLWSEQGKTQVLEEYDASAPEDDRAREVWRRLALTRALEEARAKFEARTFEAFELFSSRGVPAEEVASRLGISVDSVHQASTRVRRAVRECFTRIMETDTLDE
jgi:RNA polymerase sigma factor (sigma-70 family)